MRALRRAAVRLTLALVLPASALAQAPAAGRTDLLGSGRGSVPGWWGAPGRAGWLPDGDVGAGQPWTLAGLVAGAWALEGSGRVTTTLPPPGVAGARAPLAWFDTVSVVAGEGGGWEGFAAALARATVGPGVTNRPGPDGRPRADLLVLSGPGGLNDHALTLWRGDSLGGLRLEAASGGRPATGGLFDAERDQYEVSGSRVRGGHSVEAGFAHRRSMATLADGARQETRGEGGHARYRYQDARWQVDAMLERAYDWHETFGGGWTPGVRLADANAGAIAVERAGERGQLGLRWAVSETQVVFDPSASGPQGGRAVWGAARWRGPFEGGRLEASLGLGRLGALRRTELAPSFAWRFSGRPWDGRLVLERLLVPIWSDLAAGQSPFLQQTWVGGLEVGGRAVGGARARIGFLAGRTRGRALLGRLPLESLALRSGYRADVNPYDFGLLSGEAVWRSSHWSVGLEGFALARDVSPLQPRVDPGRGGRLTAQAAVAIFHGDLVVRPRLEGAAIGSRESEAVPSRPLPGYATVSAGLELTLADAVLLVELRNLEDRRRPHTWVDATTGVEAFGPGRELRLTFAWRLWD